MAIPQTNVSWNGLQTEFGGVNPINASEYRRGYYVPDLTSNSTVPSTNSDLAASKWRGAIKQTTYIYRDMYQLSCSDNSAPSYFYSLDVGESGGISAGGYTECWSNTSEVITTPNVSYPLKLSVTGYYATIGNGYRYTYDPYGTTYYKDRASTPGLRLLASDNTTIIGSSDSADTREIWWDAYQTNQSIYTPGFTVIVQPNTEYHLKYKCNWYMAGGGRNTFVVYTYYRPTITVYNY